MMLTVNMLLTCILYYDYTSGTMSRSAITSDLFQVKPHFYSTTCIYTRVIKLSLITVSRVTCGAHDLRVSSRHNFRPSCDQNFSQVHAVDKFLSRVSYLPSYNVHVFFGDAIALLRESYRLFQRNSYVYVYCSYLIELILCFWSSMYRFILPLLILVPQDSNVALYTQVC